MNFKSESGRVSKKTPGSGSGLGTCWHWQLKSAWNISFGRQLLAANIVFYRQISFSQLRDEVKNYFQILQQHNMFPNISHLYIIYEKKLPLSKLIENYEGAESKNVPQNLERSTTKIGI